MYSACLDIKKSTTASEKHECREQWTKVSRLTDILSFQTKLCIHEVDKMFVAVVWKKRQYPSESESPCNKCCVCFSFYFCLWNVYRHKFIENIVCKDLNTFSTFQYKEVVRSVLIKHKLKLTYFSLLQLIHQQCSTKSNIIDRGEKPIKLMHRSSNRKINHIMIYFLAAH